MVLNTEEFLPKISMAQGNNGYNFKIVLLGEGCVGKTSCVLRYVEDKFNDKHITTLQVGKLKKNPKPVQILHLLVTKPFISS